MKITISNNAKPMFHLLSMGEIFLINETDVCMRINYSSNMPNAWNFRTKTIQEINDNTKVTIPKEVSMEVII